MQTIYEAAGAMDGMRRLADAWHRRVMEDAVVSHAFSHGFHPHHTERLAAYWAEVLGGPTAFSQAYGDETAVVRMHSGNGEHDEMDTRAIASAPNTPSAAVAAYAGSSAALSSLRQLPTDEIGRPGSTRRMASRTSAAMAAALRRDRTISTVSELDCFKMG